MSRLAIVGSGVVGALVAWEAVQEGLEVDVFEKGASLQHPHERAYEDEILAGLPGPRVQPPPDLKGLTTSGQYPQDLDRERIMTVGGGCTRWGGALGRLDPADFRSGSRFGLGLDWLLRYEDLEPFYARAEALLGASGDDRDNPWAPPRSGPYPLAAFPFSHDLLVLNERLAGHGLQVYPSPQARLPEEYDGRPRCVNYRTCKVCPIGARYSPNHHLDKAVATGRCRVHPEASVRRILVGRAGRATGIAWRGRGDSSDREHPADRVVVAAGALESARLLMLSKGPAHPDGLGNAGGHLGRHLTLQHIWPAHVHYPERLHPGRQGVDGGQTRRFAAHPDRARRGGCLVQMRSETAAFAHDLVPLEARTGRDVLQAMSALPRCQVVHLHAEAPPAESRYAGLSEKRDRYGDPFLHVHYGFTEYDHATLAFAQGLLERLARASGGEPAAPLALDQITSGCHHMGTCRMAPDASKGVTDAFGAVHGVEGLYVLGGAVFPGSSAIHPTLTMAAHGLYAARRIVEELQGLR